MTLAALDGLVTQVAQAVRDLRQALEASEVKALEDILAQTSNALNAINGYAGGVMQGGGVEKLRADILALGEPDSQRLMSELNQASIDHRVNGELIKLAMQRSAALQSFVAQQSLGATYEIGGGIPGVSGNLLSKKV